MTTYETKFGTATITSGRMMTAGKWGVMATIGGKKAFLTFDGKPDLEAAFPPPAYFGKKVGKASDAGVLRPEDMDRENSKY